MLCELRSTQRALLNMPVVCLGVEVFDHAIEGRVLEAVCGIVECDKAMQREIVDVELVALLQDGEVFRQVDGNRIGFAAFDFVDKLERGFLHMSARCNERCGGSVRARLRKIRGTCGRQAHYGSKPSRQSRYNHRPPRYILRSAILGYDLGLREVLPCPVLPTTSERLRSHLTA